jgi:hypothetical protein
MSTPASGGGLLSSIGNGLISAITGTSISDLQAQASAAEQQLQIAIGTMIALEAIAVLELLFIAAIMWKERH